MRAVRIVTGAKRGTSHQLLYDETKWVSLKDRRQMFKMCFMHKIVNKTAPPYLVEILPNVVNIGAHYDLRNSNDLEQFHFRTEKFKKSLLPACIRQWNSLQECMKVESYYSFRSILNAIDNCSKLYYIGIRKFNIIHSQLRMNCSNLNAHLYGLHVIDSPACACSYSTENVEHFFLDCPLYSTQRLILRDAVSEFADFTVHNLLFGDDTIDFNNNIEIVLAVHDFIKDSERFST